MLHRNELYLPLFGSRISMHFSMNSISIVSILDINLQLLLKLRITHFINLAIIESYNIHYVQ